MNPRSLSNLSPQSAGSDRRKQLPMSSAHPFLRSDPAEENKTRLIGDLLRVKEQEGHNFERYQPTPAHAGNTGWPWRFRSSDLNRTESCIQIRWSPGSHFSPSAKLFKIGLAIAEPGQSRMRGACLMALIGPLRLAQLMVIQLSGFSLRLFLSWRTMRHEGTMPLKRSEHEPIRRQTHAGC